MEGFVYINEVCVVVGLVVGFVVGFFVRKNNPNLLDKEMEKLMKDGKLTAEEAMGSLKARIEREVAELKAKLRK